MQRALNDIGLERRQPFHTMSSRRTATSTGRRTSQSLCATTVSKLWRSSTIVAGVCCCIQPACVSVSNPLEVVAGCDEACRLRTVREVGARERARQHQYNLADIPAKSAAQCPESTRTACMPAYGNCGIHSSLNPRLDHRDAADSVARTRAFFANGRTRKLNEYPFLVDE